jgi:plasmid stabilization system protein ParE
VSRFFLSAHAQGDLLEIRAFFTPLPSAPANRIARKIQQTLNSIAENPYLGTAQSNLTLLAGTEVRSRLCSSYRILYIHSGIAPEIIGVIHTSRDIAAIMAKRLQ